MNVKQLIAYLEDIDPELPVYIRSRNTDYDYETLVVDSIDIDWVSDVDNEDGVEGRALLLGGL
ncbi:MAG: hypothetical protein PHC39_04795 [Proteiniphilum sp.]|nr:hypothetical protein [Proteiniphilum sp.]